MSTIPPPSEFQKQKLTNWKNEPTLEKLKLDLDAAKPAQQAQTAKIKRWNDLMKVEGTAKAPKIKGRSSVQPKLIRRQAEWRYSALTEPFTGSDKLFKVSPVTFEDEAAAKQNEILLNWQFRTKLNRIKFIDDYVRTTVDEGTSIIRVGWKRHTVEVDQEVPVYSYYPLQTEEELQMLQQALELKQENPRMYDEQVSDEIKAAIDYYEETQQATVAIAESTQMVKVDKVLENRPTVEILNPENFFIDPSCNGDIDKALYAVYSFETSKSDLIKEGRYKNLDKVNWENNFPLATPDHITNTPQDFQQSMTNRKKVVAYEYWGFADVLEDDKLVPFVATWIGNVLIRMEMNPFPDEKLPFVLVPYLPVKRDLYGEPDAELLEDNQKIVGAVVRGMIDLMGQSANAQKGYLKGMLDPLNRRRLENGQDYEFNPSSNPGQGLIEHKYPEIPQSAITMVTMMNQEAESLTGVKAFAGGVSGEAYGDVAAGIRGALDASSKREMAILRRLAKGITDIGNKFIAMNSEFLSEKEVVRVTNEVFVEIRREDLKGNFDLITDISTAEVDNQKSQDLAFMLQTMGPNMDMSISMMILAEIADLKRMPSLAHKLRTFKPQPDPIAEQLKQLEVQKAQMEVAKLQSEVELNQAKAQEALATKDQKNLDFVEQEKGVKHERDMEKQRGQAMGNQNLEMMKAIVKPRKADEKRPDIAAAMGFNALSGNIPQNTLQRDAAAEVDPRANLGSQYYEPGMDPATNPNLNI